MITACDDGCSECNAILGGLMSACTQCDNPSQVAVGSSCGDECLPGTYLRDGICYGKVIFLYYSTRNASFLARLAILTLFSTCFH